LRLTIARLSRCIVILLRHNLAQKNSSRIAPQNNEGRESRLVNCFAAVTLFRRENVAQPQCVRFTSLVVRSNSIQTVTYRKLSQVLVARQPTS
jgi:hypothetical protein